MQEQPGLSKNGNTTNKQSHHLDLLVDKAANANVASQPAAVNPSFLTTEGCQYYKVVVLTCKELHPYSVGEN